MPQRVSRIMRRLEELGLAGRCLTLRPRPATDAELLTCHRSDPHTWRGGLKCRHAMGWGRLEPGLAFPCCGTLEGPWREQTT